MRSRIDGRTSEAMREVKIVTGVNPYAEGSAEICFGGTKVLCTASVEQDVPRWLLEKGGGWITSEYGMLPRSTHTRMRREAAAGKQGGRTQEIQRLIGRSLRRSVDLASIPGLTIQIDCDVLCADGGTRTAAISGGWVALAQALKWAVKEGVIESAPVVHQVAAVSVGVVGGSKLVDLCYEEDSEADFDLNLVFNDKGNLIEIQGTAEQGDISRGDLHELIDLGAEGLKSVFDEQRRVLA